MTSCYQKVEKLVITDFSKFIYDTLKPINIKTIPPYSNARLKMKGLSNDTIILVLSGVEKNYFGDFEDEWNLDYYDGMTVPFEFNPHKATTAKIEVEYSIE